MDGTRNLPRSIGAIFVGIVVSVALSIGTDGILHRLGVFPALGTPAASGPLLLATGYRAIYGIVGAYIAARLAPTLPMVHAMVLGFLGFIVSIVGAVATWSKADIYGPHWYPVALVLLALPTAWLGGKLYRAK